MHLLKAYHFSILIFLFQAPGPSTIIPKCPHIDLVKLYLIHNIDIDTNSTEQIRINLFW